MTRKRTVYPRRQAGTDIASRDVAVAYVDGGPVGIDYADPASVLEAAEAAAENPPPPERSDIASLLMQHLFSDGPHPEHVTRRIFQLVAVIHPPLLVGLPLAERIVLHAPDEAAREQRLVMLLRGTRIERRRASVHERVVREVLAAAWARQRSLLMQREVPASALTDYASVCPRELLSQFAVRLETVQALLGFFFREGPSPERVVRRVFMVAKAYYEPLLLRMSLQQLGRMFGETRATWSWRGKAKLNEFLALRGMQAVKAPYQKSDEVCVKYAAAALGNRNRATGRRLAEEWEEAEAYTKANRPRVRATGRRVA